MQKSSFAERDTELQPSLLLYLSVGLVEAR